MQIQQLRYVVSVQDEGSFTNAAAALLVAQPSVSASIKALERELGSTLFDRSRGKVSLTAAGEAFLPWARQALADCEAGRSAVSDLLGLKRGRVALGATPSLTTGLLASVWRSFHLSFPRVEVLVHEAGSRDLVVSLEKGELDLALVILPVSVSTVEAVPLIEEDLVLAVGIEHPLARRQVVAVSDLEGLPLVMFREGYDLRRATIEACREAGFSPSFSVEGLEMDGVLALTTAGVGASVVPSSVVGPTSGLVALAFGDGRLKRTVGLASRRDRALSQAARAFGDHVIEGIAKLGAGWRDT